MIERLVPAKNGYTVYAGDTALHSRYNPRLEAEKYAASLKLEKPYRYFILIEPGLDYLGSLLRRRFPRAAVITLHCSAFFADKKLRPLCGGGEAEDPLSWDPLCGEGLETFLERTVTADARAIRLIEWRPSVNAYGKAYLELAGRTVECVRRISAGSVTVRNFGRRWLKNALRNLALFLHPVQVRRGTGAVVVCAAGPSLEEALDLIIRRKASSPSPLVIAVSSAVPALLHRGIAPDLVIATDGGGWALFHLYGSFRPDKSGGIKPVLAAGFTAALPSQTESSPVLIIGDGTLWQELLLGAGKFPFLRLPQRGTVSASALDLALSVSTGNVYLAGLDLTHRDLRTHARPYAFETAMDRSSSRFKPLYSQAFERAGIIRHSGSQDIYATWFRTCLESFPKRIFTLGGGRDLGIPLCPGISAMTETGGKAPVFLPVPAAGASPRGAAVLLEALNNPLMSARLSKELGELLIPDTPVENSGFSDTLRNKLLDLR
jgi:hypothetical protein